MGVYININLCHMVSEWETVAVIVIILGIFIINILTFIGICTKNKMFYDNIENV